MLIQKLSTSCSVNEANGLKNDIIRAYESSTELAGDINLAGAIADVRETGATLSAAIEHQRAENTLKAKDTDRVSAYRSLVGAVTGYTFNPIETVAQPAKLLESLFTQFGLSMLSEPYVVKSSKICVILEKLTEPSMASAVKVLAGVDLLLADLTKKESIFEETRVVYESAAAQEKILVTASDAKTEVVAAINLKLVGYVNGMAAVQENHYGEFARTIDKLISLINDAVKRRRGTKKKPDPLDPKTTIDE